MLAVSIHAPRVGRDCNGHGVIYITESFNPRAPCGARLMVRIILVYLFTFQSTRPVWGATASALRHPPERAVSIHAPRVGRDIG